MATTPEGLVKSRVKEILRSHHVYFFMPVQMGLGAAGVDFHCVSCWEGIPLAFFIETKAPGKELTPRQKEFLSARRKQGCMTFVIDGQQGLKALDRWLSTLGRNGLELDRETQAMLVGYRNAMQ